MKRAMAQEADPGPGPGPFAQLSLSDEQKAQLQALREGLPAQTSSGVATCALHERIAVQ